jgi:hypothetical protein
MLVELMRTNKGYVDACAVEQTVRIGIWHREHTPLGEKWGLLCRYVQSKNVTQKAGPGSLAHHASPHWAAPQPPSSTQGRVQ